MAALASNCRSLRKFSCGSCTFGVKGVDAVLRGCPLLEEISIKRLQGEWDHILEDVAKKAAGIVEVHLEKLKVSDRGLIALSLCPDLQVLHLVKTPECTDLGLISIAGKCRLLRNLHIDGWKTNRFGDQGLSDQRKENKSLVFALICPLILVYFSSSDIVILVN
ncbi:uncharacterized protein A4U43_C04F27010 [Asparagus officinalis]|uniref:COI1 F-box domain-containing protein n=1 Tax=Asparagus officinalis TaxID=4686 RepID=A0A5P1F3W6_ASPOF|nr:uncharacterized protein A4U43_C04F27010 [Asparagus officinalis]